MTENEENVYQIIEDNFGRMDGDVDEKINVAKQIVKSLALPHVIGIPNDLPTGRYSVGVEVAEEGTEDLSCRVWSKFENGKMVVVKVEHYL